MSDSEDTLNFFDGMSKRIYRNSKEFDIDDLEKRIRLSKTDKDARTNARLDNALSGISFDETETSKEELSEANEDIIDEFINRKIDKLIGG